MNTVANSPKQTPFRRAKLHKLVYLALIGPAGCGDPNAGPAAEPTASGATSTAPSQTTTSAPSNVTTVGPTTGATSASTTADTSGPPANVPTLAEISQILLVTCGNIICHMPPPYEPPDFSSTDDALYTLLTTYTAARCQNAPLVVPGDAAASAIIKAVTNDCGGFYMPPDTYFPFTEEELAKITAWINAGAPNQ